MQLELDQNDIYMIEWLLKEVEEKIKSCSTAYKICAGDKIEKLLMRMAILQTKIDPFLVTQKVEGWV